MVIIMHFLEFQTLYPGIYPTTRFPFHMLSDNSSPGNINALKSEKRFVLIIISSTKKIHPLSPDVLSSIENRHLFFNTSKTSVFHIAFQWQGHAVLGERRKANSCCSSTVDGTRKLKWN